MIISELMALKTIVYLEINSFEAWRNRILKVCSYFHLSLCLEKLYPQSMLLVTSKMLFTNDYHPKVCYKLIIICLQTVIQLCWHTFRHCAL